jgi:hypothetical protein
MTEADILITNARAFTMDSARPRAGALAIAGNRILKIGDKSELAALRGRNTRIINAAGNTVIPGIVESHLHIFGGSVELDSLMLNGVSGYDAIAEAVAERRKARPQESMIVGTGILHTSFGEDVPITRQLLDRIVPDLPFVTVCFDHHTIWANTKALNAAGILYGRNNLPPGNEIVLASDGAATGELREPAAYEHVLKLMPSGGREWLGMTTGGSPVPPATAEQRRTDQVFLRRGIAHAASLGITSMHNMDGNWYQLELLKAMHDRGELDSRVEVPFHHKNFFSLEQVDEAVEMRAQYHGDMLHSGRVKIFIDGVLESLTALMIDDYPGFPGNKGAPLFTAEEFNAVAARADAHNLQISVHAIGDGGVRRTLDGYEAARTRNGKRDSRHRIEHIELIDPADVPRLKTLGVCASLQPIVGLGVPGNPQEPTHSRIAGKEDFAYAWQTLRDTGAAIAFSSDWPVSPLNPFLGMQAAMISGPVGPSSPSQRQSLADCLHSYTAAGAYMEFMEDRKGTLREGYLADVVVLDRDIEATPADEIGQVRPVTTICDGRIIFEA